MKVRNGFVSNSSSSSFILCYNKNEVLEGPEAIISYIQENPNKRLVFFGQEINEGDDIFEMDDDIKSLIRRFPDLFIENTKNGVPFWNYSEGSSRGCYKYRPVRAYPNADLTYAEDLYDWNPSAEVLGITPEEELLGNPSILDENNRFVYADWFKKVIAEKIDTQNFNSEKEREQAINELHGEYVSNYYSNIRGPRELEYYRKKTTQKAKEIMDKVGYDSYEKVDIDCRSGDRVYSEDFVERYLSDEDYEDYETFANRVSRHKERPYLLCYDDVLTDIKDIYERIKTLSGKVSSEYYLFTRYNKALKNITKTENDFEFYRLGDKEIKYLLDHEKDILKLKKKYILFTNSSVILPGEEKSIPEMRNHRNLNYGHIYVVNTETNFPDFKRLFKD